MPTTQQGRSLNVSTPLEYDFLLIKRIRSREALSQLFNFDLELLHAEDENSRDATFIDPKDILGKPMVVTARQEDGTTRHFHGICVDFSQGHHNTRFSKYRATLVPRVWLLTQISQSRIFQNKPVPEILREVLDGFEFSIEVQGTFEPRNYCIQYRETDWNFISRLMEEEGIYYYFEHTEDSHKMIIANTDQSHRECPSRSTVPFIMDWSPNEAWISRILSWQNANKVRTGKFSLRDHNFQLPVSYLEAEQLSRFDIGGNKQLEIYDFPGGYAKRFDGIDSSGGEQASNLQKVFDDRQRTTNIRQQEIDVAYKTSYGTTDCCSFTAGYRFTMTNHPHGDYNGSYVLLNTQTEAVQTPAYNSDDHVSNPYIVSFAVIPQGQGQAPFRPLRQTPKPIIHGAQSAVVVGPAGEEIFTDKYGRVKVQFHWDRVGKLDSNSSCWMRVVQTWAGNKWGTMFIPRIGMEVIVDFLEGDPDQPIITGCVYNPDTMPPYTLPDEKTKSTIKSNSSKGGGGFNEFRFEDKKGSEQIFVHAEKDQDIRVKNDRKELIKHDRHLIVENDKYEKVKKDKHLQVGGDQNEKIGGTMSLTVGSNLQEKVSQNYALDAGMEVHIKAGMKAVIEAGTQVTLKVGGNFIDISPAGVTIKGTMVLINSGGAAGSGSGSNPDSPKDPKEADNADPGQRTASPPAPPPAQAKSLGPMASLMKGAAQSGSPFCDI